MCSDLLILPLSLLGNSEYESQRCYIPAQQAPETIGHWCKCVLQDGSYSVCRVAQRAGRETCCFLDNIVASAGFQHIKQHLSRLEILDCTNEVQEISCIVTINEQLLQRPQISREELRADLRIFLRYLKLVKSCQVQHARLLELGIVSIEIKAEGLTDNSCLELTPETRLHIEDVRLCLSATLPSISKYLPHGFEAPIEKLENLLRSSHRAQFKGLPLNALLVGAVGSGKSCLLGEFLRRNRCNCFYITASQVLRSYPGETEQQVRQIFEAAHTFKERMHPQLPVVILLEDLDLFCPASASAASDTKNAGNALRIAAQLYKLIDELPQRCSGILCLASSSSPDAIDTQARRAGRFGHEISINTPKEEERLQLFAALWQQQQQEQSQTELLTPSLLDFVAKHTQGYVVGDLTLLLRQLQHKLLSQTTPTAAEFEKMVHHVLLQCQPSASRATDVRVLKMTSGFETIGGMESLKRTLQVSVLAALQHSAAHARFGLTLPRGVLLYGPPGCAKTSIAKCLAKEANMTFIATSAAEVYSPYVGCAERFITQIFDTARKNAPCLIFLDEIDSLVGRRTVGGGGGSGSVQLRILSTLLTEMDGIVSASQHGHILVVAATNRPDMIDDAVMRPGRFDKLIHVPAPDLQSRLALLQLHARRMPFHPNVQLEKIAARTERFSGADICNLCNEAAIEAFQRNFDVSQIELQDFDTVLARQKSSLTQQQIESYYEFASRYL